MVKAFYTYSLHSYINAKHLPFTEAEEKTSSIEKKWEIPPYLERE